MDKIYNVLVLCTGNSARSILGEALINTLGKGRFHAFSAGSHPGGVVSPYAIEQLQAIGYPTERLRSKSWDEFAAPGAPEMDFVFTVCDKAAGEMCPIWPGHPMTAHWGFEDPAAVQGSDAEKRRAFAQVFRQIRNRVQSFVALPLDKLDAVAIKHEIMQIGQTPVDQQVHSQPATT
ncbi:Protein-tyrosine phosphatase, low molecular weight [Thiomonas sp. X19]|uniref:arsenate reductase ArsC n=1 Tax=Thiomonas sp. X19 TaxID=1050370 RepID=UPI000B67B852|nr:arsenate reductase ArsC [Thiomonas sp. X19]SCC94823.1 Protein-tyrosine phosphatase, low molecular weight [Thiomonas sp. X19]